MAKGNADCHTYSNEGRSNYERIRQDYQPPGPSQDWIHRFYPGKTLTLPVGVTAGYNWVRVL